MKNQKAFSRRDLFKIGGVTAGSWILSPLLQKVSFAALSNQKPAFRFAVASDLHFGHSRLPHYTDLLVSRLNEEKERLLDAVVLNGDITHDSTTAYKALQTELLSKLETHLLFLKQ